MCLSQEAWRRVLREEGPWTGSKQRPAQAPPLLASGPEEPVLNLKDSQETGPGAGSVLAASVSGDKAQAGGTVLPHAPPTHP